MESYDGVEPIDSDAASKCALWGCDVQVGDGKVLIKRDVGEVEPLIESLFCAPYYEGRLDLVIGIDILHLFWGNEARDEVYDAARHVFHIEGHWLAAQTDAHIADCMGDTDEQVAANEEGLARVLVGDADVGSSEFAEEDAHGQPLFTSSVVAEAGIGVAFRLWDLVFRLELLEGLCHLPYAHYDIRIGLFFN